MVNHMIHMKGGLEKDMMYMKNAINVIGKFMPDNQLNTREFQK